MINDQNQILVRKISQADLTRKQHNEFEELRKASGKVMIGIADL